MASTAGEKSHEEEEKKIPVFTVLKNGSILKNIFVVNKPPLPSDGNAENPDQQYEEILIIGRHPDCNIMLTHPSISRFHLQINSKHSSQHLSVMDLSSVHGTWVSDKRIEPGATVALNEGDTLRVGGSTRVYKLHWVPLSRAYDMEHPFVPEMDASLTEEKEEENAVETFKDGNCLLVEIKHREEKESFIEEGKEEETCQEGNSLSVENKHIEEKESFTSEGQEETCQGKNSLFSDENSEVVVKKEIPSAPPMPENMKTSFSDEEGWKGQTRYGHELGENENLWCGPVWNGLMDLLLPVGGVILETGNQPFSVRNESTQPSFATDVMSETEHIESSPTRSMEKANLSVNFGSFVSVDEVEGNRVAEILKEAKSQSSLRESLKYKNVRSLSSGPLGTESVSSFLSAGDVLSETKLDKENQTPESNLVCQLSSAKENTENPTTDGDTNLLVESNKVCSDEVLEEIENMTITTKDHEWREVSSPGSLPWRSLPLATESVSSSMPVGNVLFEITNKKLNKEYQTPKSLFAAEVLCERENLGSPAVISEKKSSVPSIWSRRGKSRSILQVQTDSSRGKIEGGKTDAEAEVQNEDTENKSIERALFSRLDGEDEEIFTPDKENFTPNTLLLKSMKKKAMLKEIKHPESNKSSFSKFTCSSNINPESTISRSDSSRGKIEGGKTDAEAEVQNEDTENKSIRKALFSRLDGEDEAIFTPDKENFTPNTLLLKSMKKKAMLKEMKSPESNKSSFSKFTCRSNINPEEDMFTSSDKENQTPKILKEQKSANSASITRARLEKEIMAVKKNAKRIPFQSIPVNSAGKSKSETSIFTSTLRSNNTVNCTWAMEKNDSLGEGKKSWNMVVDTTTLLNKESMKSLKLLQGLKGIHLIIPRMVLRELDCLKQRGSLFRSKTEVSSALEWIEDCMSETKWWIHVQNSLEEGRPIAPTPPASPQSQLSEGYWGLPSGITGSVLLSARRSLMEIVSPTAEDHVVECALLFRKIKNDGQLVLLSNDGSTKIKAMAEGLICETAEEFRESLVNPFSERFLWADSSPRGQTWSYLDDVLLWEKYHHCQLKKSWKGEGAKGLKLILLHNSHYGKTTSVS